MSATSAPTCLVLGGKGFVGGAIVAEAERHGFEVLPVDVDEYAAAVGTRCDLLINANGNSKKFLARQDPAQEFDLSVRSVQRSLHDFRAVRYVHLSTCDVYANVSDPAANTEEAAIDPAALSPYGLHKYLAEQLVRYYAPRWTILRMGGFVGPGLWKNPIYDLLHGAPLRVHPDSRYQYLHTDDFARILFELLERSDLDSQIVNVAGDGLVTLREVMALVPGHTVAPDGSAPRETYDINIGRLKSLCDVPGTVETVRAFVRTALDEREATA